MSTVSADGNYGDNETEGEESMRTIHLKAEKATPADVTAARDRALGRLGMTYRELEDKAAAGRLSGRRERVVWLTYRGIEKG